MGKKSFSRSELSDCFRGFPLEITDYLLKETKLSQLDISKAVRASDKRVGVGENLSFFLRSSGNQYLLSHDNKNRVVQSVYKNKANALCIYFSFKESGAVVCVELYSL